MKKLITSIIVLLSIFLGYVDISYAQPTISKTESFSLDQVRILARNNVSNKETYDSLISILAEFTKEHEQITGKEYYKYEDDGTEITKYQNGIFLYDYKNDLEKYTDTLEDLKLNNELKAISKYGEIANKTLEIKKAKLELDLLLTDRNIAKKKIELGMIYQNQLNTIESKLSKQSNELSIMEKQLKNLYNELSIIVGFNQDKNYLIDIESISSLIENNALDIYIPSKSVKLAINENKDIEDLEELIDKQKREIESMNQKHPSFDDKELLYLINKNNLSNIKTQIENSLEANYKNLVIDIALLLNQKDSLEYSNYILELKNKEYEQGVMSKNDFIRLSFDNISDTQDYLYQAFSVYTNIIEYNRNYEKAPFLKSSAEN